MKWIIFFMALLSTATVYGLPYGDPNQPYDRLPGTLETYHVKWATPLPGGKLKALFLVPYLNAREVVELRQRLDLDCTVIMNVGHLLWAGGYNEGADASPIQNGDQVLEKICQERLSLDQHYDCIVIGKVSWEVIPKRVRAMILDHVKRGAGLVYVSPSRALSENTVGDITNPTQADGDDSEFNTLFAGKSDPGLRQRMESSLPFDWMPLKIVENADEIKALGPPPPNADFMGLVSTQQPVSFRASQYGKGKIVGLDYYDALAGHCSLTSKADYSDLMYDFQQALLARCVLHATGRAPAVHAAVSLELAGARAGVANDPKPARSGWDQKVPQTVIARDDLGKANLALSCAGNPVKAELILEWTIRNQKAQVVERQQARVAGKDGWPAQKRVKLPSLPRGNYVADLRLLDARNAVVDFASGSFRVENPQSVGVITTDQDQYRSGNQIKGNVAFTQPLLDGQKAEACAIDTWERTVARVKVRLDAARAHGNFTIPVERPLSRLWDIEVRIVDDQGVVDASRTWVGLPDWTFDEYLWPTIFAIAPGDHTWKCGMYNRMLRSYGINASNVMLVYGNSGQYEAFERAHLAGITYGDCWGEHNIASPGRDTVGLDKERADFSIADLGELVKAYTRTGQPLDPKEYPYQWPLHAIGAEYLNDRAKTYRKAAQFGIPYIYIKTEDGLAGEFAGMENSGFTPLVTKRFQDWCRKVYRDDLRALNAEWGGDFKAWDEIRGILLKDAAQKKQLPRWVAFRYFMRSQVWDQFFIDYSDFVRCAMGYPVRTGYNGHDNFDHSRFRNQMTSGKLYVGQEMNFEYRSCVAQALLQSFSGDRGFLLSAESMMTFNFDFKTPLNNHRLPWKALFAGYRGFDWECLSAQSMGGMACTTPDYSEPMPFFKNISEQVHALQKGIGKLCIVSKPHRDPVAILWSPVNHYISRLLPLQKQGFTGGTLYNSSVDGGAVADCLVMMKNLRLNPTMIAPDDLVGGILNQRSFKALILPYNKGMSGDEAEAIRAFVKEGGLVIADNEPGGWSQFGRKLEKGQLADLFPVLDKENLVRFGKGAAGYLPDRINGYLARMEAGDYTGSDSVAHLLKQFAGVAPVIELTDANGKSRRDTLMPIFEKGSTQLVGMLRADSSVDKETEETRIQLDGKHHVWDARTGAYHGFVDALNIKLDMYPKLFALLSANPRGITLAPAKKTVRPGEILDVSLNVKFAEGSPDGIARMGQVAHVRVLGPDGAELEWYRQNVTFEGATCAVRLPISESEAPGRYSIKAFYPLAGMETDASFVVKPKEESQ
ncbi:MAG: hypothetical protein HY360_22990 [Verrucomicrobia bacterium]|nr:hypothetical protein [Verrucomicrobiota bacterium]